MTALVAPFPRLPFAVALLVLGGTLAGAAAARFSGFASPPPALPPVASVDLTFADLPDGGVAVRNAQTGGLVARIAVRDDGFLRTTMRILAAARRRQDLGAAKPFRLDRLPDGGLDLTDTATGEQLELLAFGPSNAAEFAALLAAAKTPS